MRELSQKPSNSHDARRLQVRDELEDARARGLLTDPAIELGVEANLELLDEHFEIVTHVVKTLGNDLP